jgi:hypothetical protein
VKSLNQFISESSEKLPTKVKQSGHAVAIQKVNNTTWMFKHRGMVGRVVKAWNGVRGWQYRAGNIRVNGKDVGLPVIHGTHKSMNDAIHNAYQHTMWHMSKGKKK